MKVEDYMKRFTMIDEEFKCANCHAMVPPLKYSARDHCPFCLYSMHLDNNPGDRSCECKGLLEPIGIKKHKDTYKIIYRCQKCKAEKVNIAANDDDFDLIIKLSAGMY